MQLPAFAKATGHPAAPYPSPGRVATRKCVDMRCGRRVGWRQMGAEGAMTTVTIEQMVERWSDPNARPPFKGALIDDDGCCCAQGDVLRQCGWSDERLRSAEQREADRSVAQALGISLTQAILLGVINDQQDGCPQDVLAHPERVLGNQAPRILALWRRFDAMTPRLPLGLPLGLPPGLPLGLPPGLPPRLPLGLPLGLPPGLPLGLPLMPQTRSRAPNACNHSSSSRYSGSITPASSTANGRRMR